MKKEDVWRYYGQHAVKLEEKCFAGDSGHQEREAELKAAVKEMTQALDGLGREVWLKFDRVLTAHNNCEAYTMQMMYTKGAMDAMEKWTKKEDCYA